MVANTCKSDYIEALRSLRLRLERKLETLIAAGANLDVRSKVRPRLMFADATNGGAFDQGVMENLGGYTPLLFAASAGHIEIANILINAGADIDGQAGNGASPSGSGDPQWSIGISSDVIGSGC